MEAIGKPKKEDIKELILKSKRIALLASAFPDADSVASLLAFYHLLKGMGTAAVAAVPGDLPEDCRSLPEAGAVKRDLGPQRLVIVFDTGEASVEKIDYFLEGSLLNLVVHPLKGSYRGSAVRCFNRIEDFDCFVTFKVKSLDDLGPLKEQIRAEIKKTPLLNIDTREDNERFGRLNLIDGEVSSLCELLLTRIPEWGLTLNKEAARCLLAGLRGAFSAKVSSPRLEGSPRSSLGRANKNKQDRDFSFLSSAIYPSPLSG